MKINLAENMLRFGAKNLTATSKQKLKRLAEQEQKQSGDTTPEAEPSKPNMPIRLGDTKKFAQIYGNEAATALKEICSGQRTQPTQTTHVWIPTKLGMLELIEVQNLGSRAGFGFGQLVQFYPVTLTVPVANQMTGLINNPKDITYTFLGSDAIIYNKGGSVNMNGQITVPEYAPVMEGRIDKYTWGDQNWVDRVNDSNINAQTRYRNDGLVKEMRYMANFVKNLVFLGQTKYMDALTDPGIKTIGEINTSTIGFTLHDHVKYWVSETRTPGIQKMYISISDATIAAKEAEKQKAGQLATPINTQVKK